MIRRAAFQGLRLLEFAAWRDRLRFAGLKRAYYSTLWATAAGTVGARCEPWNFGFLRISRGSVATIVRDSELRLDDHLTLELLGNKLLTFELLKERGLATPRHVRFSLGNLKPALDLMAETGRPIVVKPLAGTGGGNGVTTGITGVPDLVRAAIAAAGHDPDLLAEEQLEGHCYRLLYLDGILIDAIRRDPPRLTGDGRRSIAALARAETAARLQARPTIAMSPLHLDRDARAYLKAQELAPRSILGPGQRIVVKRAVNQNSAAENHVVMTTVHPSTVALCSKLAKDLSIRFAGFDIIARDIARPLAPANGLIGEINTTPALHHHELVASPRAPGWVAAQILDHLFSTRSGLIALPGAFAEALPMFKVAV